MFGNWPVQTTDSLIQYTSRQCDNKIAIVCSPSVRYNLLLLSKLQSVELQPMNMEGAQFAHHAQGETELLP